VSNSRLISLVTYLLVVLVLSSTPTSADKPTVNNPYGVHLLLSDLSAPNLDKYLTWAKNLVGKHGYVKQLFLPVIPQTTGAAPDWKLFVQKCYEYDLIPVVRLCSSISDGGVWQKPVADGPNNYHSIAEAIKKVVADLPRYDDHPLYIEVFNEPNNHYEWSGKSDPVEYGHFFVQVAKAIHSIGDPRIKVMNGALSPGGSYDNLKFIDVMCREVPGFIDSFDVWASHPYPIGPPQINRHNGTLAQKKWQYGIDGYLAELDVLAKYGRKDVKVMLTDTGYSLTAEGEDFLADRTLRAFRDCWSQWPEVLAVLPFTFNDPYGGFASGDWVYPDSGTDEHGRPTHAHQQYYDVWSLAKPNMPNGAINGKVREATYSTELPGAVVTLNPGGYKTTTDSRGNYYFPNSSHLEFLKPGNAYTINVQARGFAAQTKTNIPVRAGENTALNFSLKPTFMGMISGTIRDSSTGKPLPGVTVVTTPGNKSATTDKDGKYIIRGLTPTTYRVKSSKPGYYPFVSPEITVRAAENSVTSFYLGPGSQANENLLSNGDMEFGGGLAGVPVSWETPDGNAHPENYSMDSSVCFSGKRSLRVDPKGTQWNRLCQWTNYNSIHTDKKYGVECWIKATEGAKAYVRASILTNGSEHVGSIEMSAVRTTPNGWTLYKGSGIAPAFRSEKSGRIRVDIGVDSNSGIAWFDRIWVGVEK